MASTPKALVSSQILRWLRSSAGLSTEEIARRLDTAEDKIKSWEDEVAVGTPSMPQLRRLAQIYKRPISDFFLPHPMPEAPVPHDFRRLPEEGQQAYTSALRHELRLAYRRRLVALDLATELDTKFRRFEPIKSVSIDQDAEQVGVSIRNLLDIQADQQRTWKDGRLAYNAWRRKIELLDVLVFQVTTVEKSQMLGFSFAFDILPIIGINRKLLPNGRTFTLLHEFVHLLLGEGGVCDLEDAALRPPREQAVEIFCNRVAGAALVPKSDLLSHPLVAGTYGGSEWPDEVLASLAKTFAVSEEVVLRRLLIFGLTTQAFYAEKRRQYAARLADAEKKKDDDSSDFKRNMPMEVATNLGNFARIVMNGYNADAINLSDVSQYLGLKAEKVGAVSDYLR